MQADEAGIYRSRIYQNYSSARQRHVAPKSFEELEPRLHYLRRLVRNQLPADRGSSILDLGCGYGALLYVLESFGYSRVRGVDGSPEQVAAAKKLGIWGVEHGDIFDALAKTPAASVDVVVALDVIEHFSKVELIPLIDEVFRVLRPGGRWIIHVPNAEGPFSARIRYSDFTHELAFTRISVDQLLRASGFAQVYCYEDRPIAHGLKSTLRLALWHVFRAGLLIYYGVETGEFDRNCIFSQNLLAVAFKSAEVA